MSKKILYGVAVFAMAAMAAWNVNYSSQTKGMSDVSLANVEALARSEEGYDGDCSKSGGKCDIKMPDGKVLVLYNCQHP